MSADDTDESPRKLELSPVQVAASALAAVSAAFFASVAGTAGTLIGAAVGSMIATVGAATYSYSLSRTSEIARRTAAQVREGALLTATLPRPGADDTKAIPATQDPAQDAAQPEGAVTGWRRFDPRRAELPWGKVALASAAVLLITMVVITSFEGLTGRSVSDVTRGSDSGSTTVGNLVGRGGSDDEAPSEDGERPAEERTQAPEDSEPTTDPSGGTTSEPSEDPTQAPTEDVEPTPTPTPTPTPSPTPTAPPAGSQPEPADPTAPTAEPTESFTGA